MESGPAPAGRLPSHLTTFVGRVGELADIRGLLRDYRLVTLTGTGGCGKTRVAAEVAKDPGRPFTDGVVWTELAAVSSSEGVAAAVTATLRVQPPPFGSPMDAITAYLRSADVLLVLDNCEHVPDGCAAMVEVVLHDCPGVHVLATSRAPVGVEGEVLYRVPSLPTPDTDETLDVDTLRSFEAVELFEERAQRLDPSFALTAENSGVVASICRRLDGIPLAVELAAARVGVRSVHEIARGLDDRFRELTTTIRGVIPRQRTLEASVDWSYQLLSEHEALAFRRLGAFAGPFTSTSATHVASGHPIEPDDALEMLWGLVDRCLVEADPSGAETRYRLLETIREYAVRRLHEDPDEATGAHARHLCAYRDLMRKSRRELMSPAVLETLDRLDLEQENVAAAMLRAEEQQDVETVLAIAESPWWELRGHITRPRAVLERLLSTDRLEAGARARAARAAARLALQGWDLPATESWGLECLEIARGLGDEALPAAATTALATAALWMGRRTEAESLLEAARTGAERSGDGAALARIQHAQANIPFATGDLRRARLLFEASLDGARRYGQILIEWLDLHYLFLVNWAAGDDAAAEAAQQDGLEVTRRIGPLFARSTFTSFRAALLLRRGDFDAAGSALEDAYALAERSGHPVAHEMWRTFNAFLARAQGHASTAAAAFEAMAAGGRALNVPPALILGTAHAAEMLAVAGDPERGEELIRLASEGGDDYGAGVAPLTWAEGIVVLEAGDADRAEERGMAALSQAQDWGSDAYLLEALELVGRAHAARGQAFTALRFLSAVDADRRSRRWATPATAAAGRERASAQIAGVLEPEEAERLQAEGAALTLQEAVAYASRGRGKRRRPSFGWESLTPTEEKVVELVVEGLSNAEIASRLFVSLATVKSHLTHVYSKVGVTSRLQLARESAKRST